MGKGWRDDFDAMARKTVYRKLIGKWGVMSIQYQSAQEGATLAQQMQEEYIDNAPPMVFDAEPIVDATTGEVIDNG
jgi:recombination protein RecT